MADGDPQYQINEQVRGIRFYNGTPLIGISSSLTSESNLSVSLGVVRQVTPNAISGDASVFISSAGKVKQATATLNSDSIVVAASIEVLKFIAYLTSSTDVSVSTTKIAKLSQSLSSTCSTTFTARRIVESSSTQSAESNLAASSRLVKVALSNLSGLLNINISLLTSINSLIPSPISITSNIIISDIIRFTPNQRYPGSILSTFLLDGQPLTAQGRTFDSSIEQVFLENKNWNNTKSRYYNRSDAGRESFNFSWDWLPEERDQTVDKRLARNYIKTKALDPDIHTLTVITYGEDPEDVFTETQYDVFITSYNEELVRRDLVNGVYFWRCSLGLEEV